MERWRVQFTGQSADPFINLFPLFIVFGDTGIEEKKEADFMPSVLSANTIPISLFGHCESEKIFENVTKQGTMVVTKNHLPECVLISPMEYMRIVEELNDLSLLTVATDRMAHFDPSSLISEKEMYRRFNLTEADLAEFDEIEIE